MAARRGYVSLPIIVVLLAIAYLYYTTVFLVIDDWLGLSTSPGLMNAAVFSFLAFMSLFTYAIAIVRDPGCVPNTFQPDIEDPESPIHEIKRKVLLVGSASRGVQTDEQQDGGPFRASYIVCGVLLVPLTLALGILLGWHVYLILHNKTTIEYHEGVRAMWLAEKVGNIYQHPYDLGVYENLVLVLGPSIFCWMCPTSKHIGSGIRFRTFYDTTRSSVLR